MSLGMVASQAHKGICRTMVSLTKAAARLLWPVTYSKLHWLGHGFTGKVEKDDRCDRDVNLSSYLLIASKKRKGYVARETTSFSDLRWACPQGVVL